ncbi:hypothetical protein WDU94_002815 [Cyamophila willieti]
MKTFFVCVRNQWYYNDKMSSDTRKVQEDKLREKILIAKDILHKLKMYNILDKATSCDTSKFRDGDTGDDTKKKIQGKMN